jgi:hypothetical protein
MRSCLDAVMDDPVFRGEDGARLAAPQTSTRSPGRSAPCAKRYVRRSRAAPIACQEQPELERPSVAMRDREQRLAR